MVPSSLFWQVILASLGPSTLKSIKDIYKEYLYKFILLNFEVSPLGFTVKTAGIPSTPLSNPGPYAIIFDVFCGLMLTLIIVLNYCKSFPVYLKWAFLYRLSIKINCYYMVSYFWTRILTFIRFI